MKQTMITSAAECDTESRKPIVLSKIIRNKHQCTACYDIITDNIDILYLRNDGILPQTLSPEIGKAMADAAVPSFRKSKCTVHIHCSAPIQKTDDKIFREAYRNYFENMIAAEKLNRRHTIRKALTAALCSLPLFVIVFFAPVLFSPLPTAAATLVDIVKVGSWMLMWQAIDYLTFGMAEIMERIRKMQSFSDAKIIL